MASGAVGWGECVALAEPTYTSEWAQGAWLFLATQLVPAVLAGQGRRLRGHPMAHFAVETALLDARLREISLNLANALGGVKATLGRTQVLNLTRPDDVAALVESVDATAALVKLKISPGNDAAPLTVLAASGLTAIAADANGSYHHSPGEALRWLDDFGLTYLEQPGAADDLVGHAKLTSELVTPLALDESLRSVGDVAVALALGSGRVLNIKPARLGSFAGACDALDRAQRAGASAFVGGMYELGVGRAAAAAVAARTEANLPTDLGPSSAYVAQDVTDPLVCDGAGRLIVPSGPGIGVAVDRERLRGWVLAQPLEFRP